MKTQTIEAKVYTFKELSEEAQEKAIEEMGEINVWHDWHESTLEFAAEEWLGKYSIGFEPKSVCFDLYRREFYIDSKGIHIADQARFFRAISGHPGYTVPASEGTLEAYFETVHFGGGSARTHLYVSDYRDETTKELPFDTDEFFQDLCRDLLSQLSKEYDYLTSREAIEETIEANEYEFYEDGSRTRTIAAN